MADVGGDIIVVPFHDSGHIFPATELAKQLASRNHRITLILTPTAALASSVHPHVRVVELSAPDASSFRHFLAKLHDDPSFAAPPLCVIVDVMIAHLLDVCTEFGIPAVGFFTSSACSVAIEHASRELSTEDFGRGRTIRVAGFPEEMPLTAADLCRGPPPATPPPFSYGRPGFLAPKPPRSVTPLGQSTWPFPPGVPRAPLPPHGEGNRNDIPPPPPPPKTLKEIASGASALLINTCDDLERPFLEYIAAESKKPSWGVGPLLPAEFWSAAAGSVVQDGSVRPPRTAAVTEADVLRFLESKPPCSVIYVSFGSVVSPGDVELAELAAALHEVHRPFIWALQPDAMRHDPMGFPLGGLPDAPQPTYTTELAERAGERGMVIRGWAPQLLILRHRATGAFVTHSGWNSTVEALSCGVPMVTWPVRGDQHDNARLVTRVLRVGVAVESEAAVRKGDVTNGIERVMGDAEMRVRAKETARRLFAGGFPASSSASLDALLDFVRKEVEKK